MFSRIYASLNQSLRAYRLSLRELEQADLIRTETTPAEKDLLFKLARRKAGGVGVEVGSAFGASSCFIAAGLRKAGAKLYCVDTWNVEYRMEDSRIVNYLYREDGILLTYRWDDAQQKIVFTEHGKAPGDCPTYREFLTNTRTFADVICPLRNDSVAAAKEFHQAIDFLFIDGWHEYEAVKKDSDAWLHKIKPGGIVAFHDSGWARGVQRVIHDDVMPKTVSHGQLPNLFWATMR